jgi:hypothetical protein
MFDAMVASVIVDVNGESFVFKSGVVASASLQFHSEPVANLNQYVVCSPDEAQRNPGVGAAAEHFPRIPLRCMRATCCALHGPSSVFSGKGA